MIGRYFRLAAIVALGLQLAGCYTDYGPVATVPDPVLSPGTIATVLQPGEVLKVTVFGEQELTGTYPINPSGDIELPLVGSVRAAGLTRSDLQREITRRYAGGKLLQDPKVTVDIASFVPIYIVGETLRPGAYPYSAGLNVLTAITLAGGVTYRASRDSVLIQHPGQTVWQQYPFSSSVLIEPGDLIRIPERYF